MTASSEPSPKSNSNSNSSSNNGSPSSTSTTDVGGVAKKQSTPSPLSGSAATKQETLPDTKPTTAAVSGPPGRGPSNMHYYHRPYHTALSSGFDHGSASRAATATATSDGSSTTSTSRTAPPPPGPYTKAQYETCKPPPQPPLPIPHYANATAVPPPPPQTVTASGPVASASSSPPSPPKPGSAASIGREPPPAHTYHHPATMHREQASPTPPQPHHPPHPTHHHPRHHHIHHPHIPARHPVHGFQPYREDIGRVRPPPPHHRAWHGHEYGASRRYYDASNGVGPYPPPPVPRPGSTAAAAKLSPEGSVPSSTMSSPSGAMGPYRFSDTTLRREALTNLKSAKSPSTMEKSHGLFPLNTDGSITVRDGATSPSQIENYHREEVTTMGCTCKKTKCLKLYCQCFAVKIYCGKVCRCLTCHNTEDFEKERQDAVRNILARNPQAFDTKFKKSVPDKQKSNLSHKLGCKCRKSACMKKYCECFAGNVKCSASCRCIGCKNMPPGGFPPPGSVPPSVMGLPPIPMRSGVHIMNGVPGNDPGRKREPYMMNAAQNLAFLKHASPVADKQIVAPQRTASQESGDMGSMPSLTPEESQSPSDQKGEKLTTQSQESSVLSDPNTAEKTAVNALLMAAVAMTEMSGQTPTKAPPASTPPRTKPSKSDPTEEYHTPQKNLLRQFQSPKRKKAAEDADTGASPRRLDGGSSAESSPSTNTDESPKREHSGTDFTPSVQQKTKRSRIGSLKKGAQRQLSNEMNAESEAESSSPMVLATPKHAKKTLKNELTPVSARCLDFKRMHVHETEDHLSQNNQAESPAPFQAPKQVAANFSS